jgi:Cu-Zn family superoxide dismutase
MKYFMPALLLLAAASLASCATTRNLPARTIAKASITTGQGNPAGSAAIAQVGDRLTLILNVIGLSEGTHGAHLHTTGRCDAPAFTSAGAHLNPHSRMHGMLNPGGSHMGDLPNITVNPSGIGATTILLSGDPAEIETAIFDSDGSALVIHASQDDYLTDPTGNSGARIACGVLAPG